MTIHADRDASERPAAQLDTAEIRARAHQNALADARRGRNPWRTLTDDVPALCDEVDRLRAEVDLWLRQATLVRGQRKDLEAKIARVVGLARYLDQPALGGRHYADLIRAALRGTEPTEEATR